MGSYKMIVKLIHSMKQLMGYILLAVAMAVLGQVIVMLIPALIAKLGIEALQGFTIDQRWLLLLLLLAILRGGFRYGEHYFGHYVAFKVLAEFRKMVFQKLRSLAPNKSTDKNSGTLLKMIGEDIEALEIFFAHTLAPVLTGSLVTILLIFYTLQIHPLFTMMALLTYGLLTLIFPWYFAHHLEPLLQEQGKERSAYVTLFVDSLKGMQDLVQFHQVQSYFEELSNRSAIVNHKEQKVSQESFKQLIYSFLVVGLSVVLVALLLLNLYGANRLTLEEASVALMVYTSSFAIYLELNRLPLGFKRAILAGERIFELLEETKVDTAGHQSLHLLETIALDEVSFGYPNSSEYLLEGVTQSFKKGKIIGIVGPSGSGKSTLMKLIMNWYRPSEGEVLLNHQSTNQLDARLLQERMAYIPQIPQIFQQTIRDNLRLANLSLTDEEILVVAEYCNLKEAILQTPEGLDTMLNPQVPLFSAGEMQRLELTRALLKQADCYIFDEPTSHLDSLNEAEILTIIKKYCHGYVFLISHRLSTLSVADEIYRLEERRFVRQ